MLSRKHLYRVAGRLHDARAARTTHPSDENDYLFVRLCERQRELQQAQQRLRKASRHGLSFVLSALQDELFARIRDLQDAAAVLPEVPHEAAPVGFSIADLAAELREAEDDFGDLTVDWKQQTLTATTEPITLENVYLGSFAIRLCWQRLAGDVGASCFEVVALEPNPAAADERVTHPHVQDEALCAGHATAALETALRQGRLADAFRLVRGVLSHYNPHSAHIVLAAWGGEECFDCGTSLSRDDAWHCDGCDHDLCSECMRECQACEQVYCSDCLTRCAVCEGFFCQNCLRRPEHANKEVCAGCMQTCAACGAQVAADELDDQTHLCPECQEPGPNEATDSTSQPFPSPDLENDHESAIATSDAA